MNKARAAELARVYRELYNQAAADYKAAFKTVGAELWTRDVARRLSREAEQFIAARLEEGLLDIYDIVRPLTVLNSHPHVTRQQREWLDEEVNRIRQRYQERWEKLRT